MKKFGFTLAEILITLTIIGFIASVTLPSLTVSTNERQTIAAFRKAFNSLTNAAQLEEVLGEGSYGSYTNTSQLKDSLLKRTNADPELLDLTSEDVMPSSEHYKSAAKSSNKAILFRDGTALIFPNGKYMADKALKYGDDDRVNGYGVVIDINGKKGKNKLSYCGDSPTDKTRTASCDTKRTINDQFPVKIRGSLIVPNSPAAKWALAQ